jgi:hypothetical protein
MSRDYLTVDLSLPTIFVSRELLNRYIGPQPASVTLADAPRWDAAKAIPE